MKMRRLLRGYASPLVLCILFLAACGTQGVGVERTPTPDHATMVTVAALPTESAHLATPTPTPSLGKLAYVQSGDVWVKALPDGKPQRLTRDGRNREPRWSPSGQWLAFRQGENQVWVMRADRSVARPLNEGATVSAFAWSPAEDRLAYTTGVGALVVVNADGSSRRELVAQGSGRPYTGVVGMVWSPDGEWLAYEQVDVFAERYAGLWRIRADGSGATELLNAGTPATYEPILTGWSPDGSRILFWEDPQFSRSLLADGAPLLVLPAEGGQPVELADSVLAYPDFVVPGQTGTDWIAVIVGDDRGAWTNKVLHVVAISTGEDVALTSPDLAASSPAWSPDGQRIAYIAMPDHGDLGGGNEAQAGLMQRRIFVVNTQGDPQPRQLTDDPAYRDEYPFWSADGSYILFVRIDAEDQASLWLALTGDGDPRQMVDALTQKPDQSKYYGDWRTTIIPYYGHMDWGALFDWWRGPGAQPVQPKATAVTPIPTPTPAIAPGVSGPIDCADVAPFAPDCLDQPRPPELAPDVTFIGIIPAGSVRVAAWSPDRTRLAYAVVNPESGAFQGLEVRSLPDFRLEGRWAVPGIFDLTWTPDGQAVLFIFDRGDTSSIGMARLGEPDWRDLLPGGKAILAVSLGKSFVNWLGENVLAFRVGCGTGCETLYSLDIATSDLRPLVNAWGEPDAPYADLFATVYLFSPDQRWLAATSWGRGLPEAMVLEWPGPAEPLDLSARLDSRYTEAQSWMGSSLAFVAYPSGEPDNWPLPLQPDLYIWDGDTGVIRLVASSAFRAVFALTGDRLAVLFVGEPRGNEEGRIESEGSTPHLGLLRWPEGELLAAHLVSAKGVSNAFDLWRLPTPIWSPQGKALAFQPAGGGLALMNRNGHVWPMLTGKSVDWVGWGASGNLALLVGEQIWLVRGVVRMQDVVTRSYTDAVLGMALDIPAEWEVYGFQGAEAHVVALDTTGTPQGVLTFSIVGAFDTLEVLPRSL